MMLDCGRRQGDAESPGPGDHGGLSLVHRGQDVQHCDCQSRRSYAAELPMRIVSDVVVVAADDEGEVLEDWTEKRNTH